MLLVPKTSIATMVSSHLFVFFRYDSSVADLSPHSSSKQDLVVPMVSAKDT